MYKVLKWKNRYSGETGYVKSIDVKEGHFVNTPDKKDACTYANAGLLAIALKKLEEIGECKNNIFESEFAD